MPSPFGDLHVDKRLTNISLMYKNGSMIADEISPRVPVVNETDKYVRWKKDSLRSEEAKRADGAESKEIIFELDSDATYTAEEYALCSPITDRQRKNADKPIRLDVVRTMVLTDKIMLGRERRVSTLFTTQANYPAGQRVQLVGAQQWNNAAFSSTSKTDAIEVRIDAGKEAIRALIGQDPNTIIFPSAVSRVVKKDSAIRDLIKYTQNNLLINGDLPPTLFNMKVLIPGSIYDTAKQGQAFSGADVWGKHVILAYVSPVVSTEMFTASLSFQAQARQAQTWREPKKRADYVEVGEIIAEKLVSTDCMYFIEDAIA